MPPKSSEAPSPLSTAILFALADRVSHGYAIMKEIESITEGEMRLNTGSVYLALHRLLADGLIAESKGEGDDARRRYYKLTAAGRSAAKAEARRLQQLVRAATVKKLIPGMAQ
ncbi:MAG: helix-turn-helix transcriptional regulator [Gemmatimonadaceae bacterium]